MLFIPLSELNIWEKNKQTQTLQSSLKRQQLVNQPKATLKAADDQCAKLFCFRCLQILHCVAHERIYLPKSFQSFYYLHYGRGGQAFDEISAAALNRERPGNIEPN